jgi:hypothetical protein
MSGFILFACRTSMIGSRVGAGDAPSWRGVAPTVQGSKTVA